MLPTIHCRGEPEDVEPRPPNDTRRTAAWAWVEVGTRGVSGARAQDKGNQSDLTLKRILGRLKE